MLRACGKRRIVATACFAALAWLGGGRAAAQAPAFARIAVSEKSVVYVQIQRGELRAAMSAQGLQTAAPVKMHWSSTSLIRFPEFTLPVPADQLTAGVTAIKAILNWTRTWTTQATPCIMIDGLLMVSRTDGRKAKWQYVSQVEVEAGASAEKAPSINLPAMDDAKVVLSAAPVQGRLGVGVRLTAGGAELTEVRKDGQPVQVKVVVADASGAEVASKTGPLTDFGFS
jgi:hypothetical protein